MTMDKERFEELETIVYALLKHLGLEIDFIPERFEISEASKEEEKESD